MGMNKREVTIHPFGVDVAIITGDSVRSCVDIYNERYEPKINDPDNTIRVNTSAICVFDFDDDGFPVCMMVIPYDTKDEIIVHECFHMIMHVARDKRCVWSDDSDEWYAYCLKNFYKDVKEVVQDEKAKAKENTGSQSVD